MKILIINVQKIKTCEKVPQISTEVVTSLTFEFKFIAVKVVVCYFHIEKAQTITRD